MKRPRNPLYQALDGMLLVAVWIQAMMMAVGIHTIRGATGDVIGLEVLSLLLTPLFIGYVVKHWRLSTQGETILFGDLIAKVFVPLVLFLGLLALGFT